VNIEAVQLEPASARIMRLIKSFGFFLTHWRTSGFHSMCRVIGERVYIRYQEWWFGIHTEAVIQLNQLKLEHPDRRFYVPTNYHAFAAVLDRLNIQPERDVFLDFGSGLGRAVILAAMHPFRRVIGVEISAELNQVAQQNLCRAVRRLRCRSVELITADGATYRIPPDVTIIFLYNPFCGLVLEKVLKNIRESLLEKPREVRLICQVPKQSAFEVDLQHQSHFTLEREERFNQNVRYLFYKANLGFTSHPTHDAASSATGQTHSGVNRKQVDVSVPNSRLNGVM